MVKITRPVGTVKFAGEYCGQPLTGLSEIVRFSYDVVVGGVTPGVPGGIPTTSPTVTPNAMRMPAMKYARKVLVVSPDAETVGTRARARAARAARPRAHARGIQWSMEYAEPAPPTTSAR